MGKKMSNRANPRITFPWYGVPTYTRTLGVITTIKPYRYRKCKICHRTFAKNYYSFLGGRVRSR
jgi:hypothetical protein